jgi:hypothetical protein
MPRTKVAADRTCEENRMMLDRNYRAATIILLLACLLVPPAALWAVDAVQGPSPDGLRCRGDAGETVCELMGSSGLGLFGHTVLGAVNERDIDRAEVYCPRPRGRSSPGCWAMLRLKDDARRYLLSYAFESQARRSAARINAYLLGSSEPTFEERTSLGSTILWIVGPLSLVLAMAFAIAAALRRVLSVRAVHTGDTGDTGT